MPHLHINTELQCLHWYFALIPLQLVLKPLHYWWLNLTTSRLPRFFIGWKIGYCYLVGNEFGSWYTSLGTASKNCPTQWTVLLFRLINNTYYESYVKAILVVQSASVLGWPNYFLLNIVCSINWLHISTIFEASSTNMAAELVGQSYKPIQESYAEVRASTIFSASNHIVV